MPRDPAVALAVSADSTPLLTEEQRAALDAALAEKEKEHRIAAQQQHRHVSGEAGDRKSRHGKGTGAAKKGGAGGKYTWGQLVMDSTYASGVLDKDDPNYDSEEERAVLVQSQQSRLKSEVQAYKQAVQTIVDEFFSSGDTSDAAESLEELGIVGYTHYFVKRLVTNALDRNDREREMASSLLSNLYAEVIPGEQVQKGVMSLVDSLDDLVLDVPSAVELLSLFIARAVVDDVLPPAFVKNISGAEGSRQADLRTKIEGQLSARHAAEKLLRCWGAGAGLNYQDTKASITALLNEFVASHDHAEAARRLHQLAVPFFHHELVKQAIHLSMEHLNHAPALMDLLARLNESGEVSSSQLAKGLARVTEQLEDTVLDNPAAREHYNKVLDIAREKNLFDTASVPTAAADTNGHPEKPSVGLSEYKAAVIAAIKEYFDSQDAAEVANRITSLEDPGLTYIFVKYAISLACDRRDRERELVSNLLVSLYPTVIDDEQMSKGFQRLLAATDDLVLDIPDAVHLLSLFLGRAIVDEILPPSFLTKALSAIDASSLGVAVVKSAGALMSARHGREQLTNCWKGGILSLEEMRQQIRTALAEYAINRDAQEATRCLKELNVPHYHHEVVVAALEKAFDKAGADMACMLGLLSGLAASGDITQTQMAKGFSRVKAKLDDEVLDFPHAKELFAEAVAKGVAEGWLPASEEVEA